MPLAQDFNFASARLLPWTRWRKAFALCSTIPVGFADKTHPLLFLAQK